MELMNGHQNNTKKTVSCFFFDKIFEKIETESYPFIFDTSLFAHAVKNKITEKKFKSFIFIIRIYKQVH